MDEPNLLGQNGEDTARNYLTEKGYAILHSNWRWKKYELDIVATKDNELVVVEVKTRTEAYLHYPEKSVDEGKINRTIAAANVYVRIFKVNMPVRFDIITLIKQGNNYNYAIEHIEDAFVVPLSRTPRHRRR